MIKFWLAFRWYYDFFRRTTDGFGQRRHPAALSPEQGFVGLFFLLVPCLLSYFIYESLTVFGIEDILSDVTLTMICTGLALIYYVVISVLD